MKTYEVQLCIIAVSEWVLSKFNGTSTPKGSYRAKTGDNDCNVNSSHYSLSTALCVSIRYQAKSEQNVRQDLIPRVGHGEAALSTPCIMHSRFLSIALETDNAATNTGGPNHVARGYMQSIYFGL